MPLPLTHAIMVGKLQPMALKERCLPTQSYRSSIAKLERVYTTARDTERQIDEALAPWLKGEKWTQGLDEIFATNRGFAEGCSRLLLQLRHEHMHYEAGIQYLLPKQGNMMYDFVHAIQRAEARRLKLRLGEEIGRMGSDLEARVLLCEVMDRVYGMEMSLHELCGIFPDNFLYLQLKGGMASLYLELMADFGCYLDEEDCREYDDHLLEECFALPLGQKELRQYESLCLIARMKRFMACYGQAVGWLPPCSEDAQGPDFSPRAVDQCVGRAKELYRQLAERMVQEPQALYLQQAVCTMENYLFCLLHLADLRKVPHYNSLSDAGWTASQVSALLEGEYARHLQYSEGRAVVQWIEAKLLDPKLAFLLDVGAVCQASIPRRMVANLHDKKCLYQHFFDCSFRPLQEESHWTQQVPAAPVARPEVDRRRIVNHFRFLCERRDRQGEPLMTVDDVVKVTEWFILFLTQQTWDHPGVKRKLSLPKGYAGVVYGAFLSCCDQQEVEMRKVAWFIVQVFDSKSEVDNLVKNSPRFKSNYKHYIDELRAA